MHFMEAATGHRCVDCHVQEANGQFSFEKDDKRPKATAREMIKIVKTVNDEFFKGAVNVTCATCHKGARPQGQPPLAQLLTPEQVTAMAAQAARGAAQGPAGAPQGAGRGQGAPAQGGPGAAAGQGGGGRGPGIPNVPIDEVLDRYIAAIGGRAAVAQLQSLVMSGTVTNRAGQDLPFTIEEKGPDKYREGIQAQPAATTRAFDGTAGWLQSGQTLSNLGDFRLQEALRISDLGRPLAIKERYKGLRGARPPQIDGKTVIAMTGELSASVSETLVVRPDERPPSAADRRHQDSGRQFARADRLQRLSRRGRREAAVPDQACDVGSPRQLQGR